ncbi:MAG: hypothetical protein IKC58_05170 [Clostridia bacterium]|nr:hypothetical protein [Clostridia bacterium]
MKNAFLEKLKESLTSVLPVVVIVLVLSFTPLVDLTGYEIGVFCFSSFLLILGMGLFSLGACVMSQGVDKILMDAFCIVAMIAMTPLITIQLLGFRTVMERQLKSRIAQRKIISAEDDQIINFM